MPSSLLATAPNETLEVLPRPVIDLVCAQGRLRLLARLVGIAVQEEVRNLLVLGDLEFGAHTRSRIGLLAADDADGVNTLYPSARLGFPVVVDVLLDGPVSEAERTIVVLRLANE